MTGAGRDNRGNHDQRDHRDHLLGVFEDREHAEAAADSARSAGADPASVRVGDERDAVASIEAEMREEMEESWVSPQAAFALTKEQSKGAAIGTGVFVAIGLLVGLPFGFVPLGDLALVTRLVITSAIGAVAGATVGLVAGAGFRSQHAGDQLAAERGVTVRVGDGREEVIDAMRSQEPLRVDRVRPGHGRVDTPVAGEDQGSADDLVGMLKEPEGDWQATRERNG